MDERVYDAMAEQTVIGSILLDPRCLPEVERSLRPEDFRLEADRVLYRAALALEREGGKLDVGKAGGRQGRMRVVKDLGLREPYIGQCELVSGEIAVDFANYFTASEQQPSLVSLGVLTHGDAVLKAGGLLIQPLPGCTEETLQQLELRTPMFADISRELTFESAEELMAGWFRGMEPKILERTPIAWACGCSRERMEKALISLGRKELEELCADPKGAELGCHFCHSRYAFTPAQLQELLARASRP